MPPGGSGGGGGGGGGGTFSFTAFVDAPAVSYSTDDFSITISFKYTETGFSFSSGILCTINGESATVYSTSGTGGNATATIRQIDNTALYNKIFTQGYKQVYRLTYNSVTPIYSSTSTYYYSAALDSNNISLETNGNQLTTVNISTRNKSILLPPIASKPGYIYRVKITGYASPNLLRISPYLTGFTNSNELIAGTPPYDSMIDGASSTIRLDGQNYSISIVSDGSNWSIINLYVSSLLTPAVSTVSGSSLTESTPTQILFHSTANILNVIIAPMNYSFIKYISIVNKQISSATFYIYFPLGKSVDNVTSGGSERLAITLSIPVNSIASIILTYANSQYYILGYYIFGLGDNITNNTSSTSGALLSQNLNFSNTSSNATINYELPPTITSTNYSIVNILKINNDTSTVNTVTINIPSSQTSSYFTVTTGTSIKQLSISVTSNRYTCIWLAKYYNSTYGTIIIPVYYYLATSAGGGITP